MHTSKTPETPATRHAGSNSSSHSASQAAGHPPPTESFSARLAAAIRSRGTPACVGLDPKADSLPPALLATATANTGTTHPSAHDPKVLAPLFAKFCCDIIDVVAPLVPIVKPQLACFEALGPHGMLALADTIDHAHARGLLVLADGKRGDIGSTAEAYADGWLGGPWHADALTVNPYLGLDSVEPFVKVATARHAGIFILVKTSNPGSKDFQELDAQGSPLYEHVAAGVEQLAARTTTATTGPAAAGSAPHAIHPIDARYGAVGAVVGATWPRQLEALRATMPHTWILVPGFGKQGGRATDTRGAFDADGLGAIIVSARDIIYAHSRAEMNAGLAPAQWQTAVERACRDMIDRLATDTPAGTLRLSHGA